MSSRREEKELRRAQRLAAEQAAAAAQQRRQRIRSVVGGVAVTLVVAGAGYVGVTALVGDGSSGEAAAGTLPAVRTADIDEAVKAAGCTLTENENEGAVHEEKDFVASDYKSNPPTSGTHAPDWYQDGIYAAGDTPELGKLIHTLEHGRVNIQYRKGSPPSTVAQLDALTTEQEGGYHLLLHENATNMPFAVAATAWDQSLGCPQMNDRVFDAIRAFRAEYIDKGPEVVP